MLMTCGVVAIVCVYVCVCVCVCVCVDCALLRPSYCASVQCVMCR